jgi:hypothetical protein
MSNNYFATITDILRREREDTDGWLRDSRCFFMRQCMRKDVLAVLQGKNLSFPPPALVSDLRGKAVSRRKPFEIIKQTVF